MSTLLNLANLNWPAQFIRSKSQWASVRCVGTSCLVWGANSRQTWHMLLDRRTPVSCHRCHFPCATLSCRSRKRSLPWPITGRQQVCGHSGLITRYLMCLCMYDKTWIPRCKPNVLNGTRKTIKLLKMLSLFYVSLVSQSGHWKRQHAMFRGLWISQLKLNLIQAWLSLHQIMSHFLIKWGM